MKNKVLPITDLHCDLLLYLAQVPGASITTTKDIGITLPHMQAGGIKHQVLAIFSPTDKNSVHRGEQQLTAYQELVKLPEFYTCSTAAERQVGIGLTLAIENASAFALEEESLQSAFDRLDHILKMGKRLFYITMTHHTENRFGGGNYTEVGLKPDGEQLLEYMAQHNITIDLSHTSDALAHDILNYLEKQGLSIPVIASHSNFRVLRDHPRNLPVELVQEIVRRRGLIGANFLRLFLDGSSASSLLDHIQYGLEHAPDAMAFGADFFYRLGIPDPARQPLFFPEYEDAGQYPKILQQLSRRGATNEQLAKLAYGNVQRFMEENWG